MSVKKQIDKNELAEVLAKSTPKSWRASQITDAFLADFNKELVNIVKLYPKFDVLGDDYQGKADDMLYGSLQKLEKNHPDMKLDVPSIPGFKAPDNENVNESIQWPSAYKGITFEEDVCEQALDEKFAIESWKAVSSTMSKFPSRFVQGAAARSMDWISFKGNVKTLIPQIAAYLLGPELDGDVGCWEGNAPMISESKTLTIKELKGGKDIAGKIFEVLKEKYPMSLGIKAAMKHQVVPNLHVRIYENSTELDATEFADMAAALNTSAQELAKIVHGFVAKAIGAAMGGAGTKKEAAEPKPLEGTMDQTEGKNNPYVDEENEIVACYTECADGGMNSDECIAKCCEKFNQPEDRVRKVLQDHNVNVTDAADTTATLKSEAPKPANNADVAANSGPTVEGPQKTEIEQKMAERDRLKALLEKNPKDDETKKSLNVILKALGEPEIKEAAEQPFKAHVNKQYQTASGQVMTLRKMTTGPNPLLIFEDDNTGDKVEIAQDKFAGMNPTEVNIDSTKIRKSLINKFKRKINLQAMKTTARLILKKGGRKIYENLDSIKSGGRPVGDIAGVVIGSAGGKENTEFYPGDGAKSTTGKNEFEGEIQSVEMNEGNEPEVIVKTPDGEEVTISVKDFADAEPEHMELEEPVQEHLEYKGYSLLQNAEDNTWSVLKGDEKIEDACGLSEADAKKYVDDLLEEEQPGAGAGGEKEEGAEEEEKEEGMSESIQKRFITESKSGGIKLKTFSQVLEETKNPVLKRALKPTTAAKKPTAEFKKLAATKK